MFVVAADYGFYVFHARIAQFDRVLIGDFVQGDPTGKWRFSSLKNSFAMLVVIYFEYGGLNQIILRLRCFFS